MQRFGFGFGIVHVTIIYNPHPFHISKKFYKLQKTQESMFENVCAAASSKDGESYVMASGFYVGESHYVIVLQSMLGEVLELSVTDLEEPIF